MILIFQHVIQNSDLIASADGSGQDFVKIHVNINPPFNDTNYCVAAEVQDLDNLPFGPTGNYGVSAIVNLATTGYDVLVLVEASPPTTVVGHRIAVTNTIVRLR